MAARHAPVAAELISSPREGDEWSQAHWLGGGLHPSGTSNRKSANHPRRAAGLKVNKEGLTHTTAGDESGTTPHPPKAIREAVMPLERQAAVVHAGSGFFSDSLGRS